MTHTKLLENLARATEQMTNQLKLIEFQNDLLKLDREWDSLRDRLLERRPDGKFEEPSVGGGMFGVVVVAATAVLLLCLLGRNLDPGSAILIGLVVVGVAFYAARQAIANANEYHRMKTAFKRKRASLSAQIEQIRRRQ